jgi:hypothetical protein
VPPLALPKHMTRLQAELHRLYLPHDPQQGAPGEGPGTVGANAQVKAMMLELARPAGWNDLATVWRGVQADLQLPAPSIAVSGTDGFQLWFSLSEPIPVAQAIAFLESLRTRYLDGIAPNRIRMEPCPGGDATGHAQRDLLPPVERAAGQWSAFVAPDLAKLFADEPWLDVPPGSDAQADLLSHVDSMKTEDFQRALVLLGPAEAPASTQARDGGVGVGRPESGPMHASPAAVSTGSNPRLFLLGIMNDPAIEMHLRIEAAKALLPYMKGAQPS